MVLVEISPSYRVCSPACTMWGPECLRKTKLIFVSWRSNHYIISGNQLNYEIRIRGDGWMGKARALAPFSRWTGPILSC